MRCARRHVVWIGHAVWCEPALRGALRREQIEVTLYDSVKQFDAAHAPSLWAFVLAAETEEEVDDGAQCARVLWNHHGGAAGLWILRRPSVDLLNRVWRSGASDVLLWPCDVDNAARFILSAGERWEPIGKEASDALRSSERLHLLTSRERHLVELLADGMWIKNIARRWGTSPNTVRNQRTSAMEKLNARTEWEMLRPVVTQRWLNHFSRLRGLTEPEERSREPRGGEPNPE